MRKLIDEQENIESNSEPITVSFVYNSIKQSNSSLKRRNKKSLEESIERALQILKLDTEEEDDNSSQIEKSVVDFDVCVFKRLDLDLSNKSRRII